MVRRHEIQVLRRAGHTLVETAELVGASQRGARSGRRCSSRTRARSPSPASTGAPHAYTPRSKRSVATGRSLGRAVIQSGFSTLFVSTTALLAALSRAHAEGQFGDQLAFYAKPKLLIIDERGYLPLERASAHLFFLLVARRHERDGRVHPVHHQPVR